MKIQNLKTCIKLSNSFANDGRLRFKVRKSVSEFGETYSVRTLPIHNDVYLEWQIGYDRADGDTEKPTTLSDLRFVGANRKLKNPYELSEIFHFFVSNKFVSISELENLINLVKNTSTFIDQIYPINVTPDNKVTINQIDYDKSHINLPTLKHTINGITIEISIQKQQYASGVQPMVYLSIPVSKLSNISVYHGKTTRPGDEWELLLDSSHKQLLTNLVMSFASCSKAHNHDILEILKLILSKNKTS